MTEIHIFDIAAWCEFIGSGSGLSFDHGYHLFLNDEEIKDLVIPDGVTKIGKCAFRSFTYLTSVTIPGSVTSLDEGAFSRCSGLTSVIMHEGLTSIGKYAFDYCSSLTSITIPSSVESIGQYAFDGCTGLTSLIIGCVNIPDRAFQNCKSLTSLTIEEGVKSIGECAFDHCEGLTSVTIPNSVKSIGEYVFRYCEGLTSVTIPNSVTEMAQTAFWYCNLTTPLYNDTYFFFHDGYIQGACVIPEGIQYIQRMAFSDSKYMTSVTIPASVVTIGDRAFLKCHFDDMYCYVKTPIGANNLFEMTDLSNSTLHVPAASLEAYKTTEPWSQFGNIVALTDEEMAIGNITIEKTDVKDIFDLGGSRTNQLKQGLNIIRTKDGKTMKVWVK